jgi:probable rRNA maturation factor
VDPDSRRRLAVTVSDGRGRAVRAPGLAAWLTAVAPAAARGDIAIALVSDRRIRTLNRSYRRKDVPTDVLSFDPCDIVISTDTARRQAREAGHSYATELKVLALHGLLHLLGYDHHAADDRGRMARLERRLRAKGNLQAGLIERAQASKAGRERAQRSEPRGRREPAKRRARARVGESEGRRLSGKR